MSGGRRRNLYRMPMHFGPMPGPRQGPDGEQFGWSALPERTSGIVHETDWLGHRFFDLHIDNLRPAKASPPPPPPLPLLQYKYIPCTGKWGEADVAYATMTPVNSKSVVPERLEGRGSFRFSPSSWEQLPTLFHIVNALADLPVVEVTSAAVTRSLGATDLSEQIALIPSADVDAIGAEHGEDRCVFYR